MVKLKFLGEIKIEWEGIEISEKISSKGVAILAILMMQKSRRISRRELLGLLWPDSSEEAAKYNLRYNLWLLKKVLNQTDSPLLMISKEFCWINRNGTYQCDLCQILEGEIAERDDVEYLEFIMGFFTGDFLQNQYFAGCDEFEEMIIMQRYYLENKKLEILKRLIALYDDLGEQDKCLQALLNCEEMDPYDMENAERRMEILFAKGSYAEGRKFYQGYYNRLTRDLSIEPSEKLKKLAGAIKSEKKVENGCFVVKPDAIQCIDCYWMADFLQKLLECSEFSILDYLPKERIQDLSYIQYRLGECAVQPPMVRILHSFVDLVLNICKKDNKVEILIDDLSKVDPISKEAIAILQGKITQNLIIKKSANGKLSSNH